MVTDIILGKKYLLGGFASPNFGDTFQKNSNNVLIILKKNGSKTRQISNLPSNSWESLLLSPKQLNYKTGKNDCGVP